MADLSAYRTLGRSGLVVSPLGLGTMTFGADRWGASSEASGAILDAYVEGGGNFIDTADVYAGGRSETLVGAYIAERKLRDRMVLATKFTWNGDPGNPNGGGNGRKNIHRALDASLRRLQTDYIDLYWLHFWDMTTPAEEVLDTLVDLVRAGRIRYFALSDTPAWYATKMAVLAQQQGRPGPIALQLEYSLVERTAEREHLPAARELGLGFTPWGPLASGFLAGKYATAQQGGGADRLGGPNPDGDRRFTDRNWRILEVLRQVATELDRPVAQAALAWCAAQPGVTAPLIGASRPQQVADSIAALEIRFSADQLARLAAVSAQDPAFPYFAYTDELRRNIFGGHDVKPWG